MNKKLKKTSKILKEMEIKCLIHRFNLNKKIKR
jgi:hypothetical protein